MAVVSLAGQVDFVLLGRARRRRCAIVRGQRAPPTKSAQHNHTTKALHVPCCLFQRYQICRLDEAIGKADVIQIGACGAVRFGFFDDSESHTSKGLNLYVSRLLFDVHSKYFLAMLVKISRLFNTLCR